MRTFLLIIFPYGLLLFAHSIFDDRNVPNDRPAENPDQFVRAFGVADKDHDERITLKEFLVNRQPAEVARRDFKLFDLDEDGFLDLAEFSAIPNVVLGADRGPLPDPMNLVLEQLVESLDKHFGDWDARPKDEIQSMMFVQDLNRHFSDRAIRFNNTMVDENASGTVSRQEARRFLEIQFGIRRGDGTLLRNPDGRILNYTLFLHLDSNRNGSIERAEYLDRAAFTDNREREFNDGDSNKDGTISFVEWRNFPLRGLLDPINEFRKLDTNLDALVSPEELKAGTEGWKREFSAYAFPGFDLDHDGQLSLPEYRLTPPANPVLPWDSKMTDDDSSLALTFKEFRFDFAIFPAVDRQQFPLLRLLVFHRLDLNSSDQLEQNEYFFKTRAPDEFFEINEDGSGWKSIFKFSGHSACGSVSVSPDGQSIAFDSWPEKQEVGSAIFVMKLSGGRPRQLCSGMMPNWSKDGQFLVCSRNEQKSGVWIIEANGSGQDWLGAGWGAQWSPDGERIALTQGPELKIYNLAKDDFETILDGNTSPYQQIFWNMAWSPDSRQLCFKGTKRDGAQEVATIEVHGKKHEIKVHYSTMQSINADFAWHPTQNRIVFAMICKERSVMQLYEFDPTKDDAPQLVKGQDETRNNTDVCWTPDGKRLFVISGDF